MHFKKMKSSFFVRIRIFLKSLVSRIVPKNVKGGPLGVFQHPFFCKIEKKLKGTLWRHLKNCEKSLKKPKKHAKKIGQVRDSNPRSSAWQTSKNQKQKLY